MVWSDGDSDGDGSDGGDGGDDGDCYYEAAVVVVDDDAPVDIDPMVEVAAQNMQEGRLQVQQVCGNVWENADLLAAVLELALPAAELRTVMAVSSGWRRAALRAGERWQKLGDDPRLFLGPPLRVAEFAQFPWHRAHAAAQRAAASLRAHELVQLRASRDFLNASLLPGGWRHCEVVGGWYATSTTPSTGTTASTSTASATSNATIYRYYPDAVAQSGMLEELGQDRAMVAALELEPNNAADPNAIKVMAVRPTDGQRFHVGYLPPRPPRHSLPRILSRRFPSRRFPSRRFPSRRRRSRQQRCPQGRRRAGRGSRCLDCTRSDGVAARPRGLPAGPVSLCVPAPQVARAI